MRNTSNVTFRAIGPKLLGYVTLSGEEWCPEHKAAHTTYTNGMSDEPSVPVYEGEGTIECLDCERDEH